jgi:hypothetical protein
MTKTYEYNENLAVMDTETHNALVSYFNKIQKLAENKKFEWEDEQIPEENYGITFNFDVWLEYALSDMEKCYEFYRQEIPKNLKEDTIDYVNQIKDYIDGFLLMPVTLYNHKMVGAESYKVEGKNFDEIVKFVKELKENNEKVFLYEIFYNPGITEDTVIEMENSKHVFLKIVNSFRLRYGVINDVS